MQRSAGVFHYMEVVAKPLVFPLRMCVIVKFVIQNLGEDLKLRWRFLPRLCKIKYDSGPMEELMYVDMPRKYSTPSGHIVLSMEKQ